MTNSLDVVEARATEQVNCPSRNEWARDNIRPGNWPPSTDCYYGRWRLPCLSPQCSRHSPRRSASARGRALHRELRYTHPRTGADMEVRHAVRVPRDLPFDLKIGEHVELVCWGVMASGMLRHPVLRAAR